MAQEATTTALKPCHTTTSISFTKQSTIHTISNPHPPPPPPPPRPRPPSPPPFPPPLLFQTRPSLTATPTLASTPLFPGIRPCPSPAVAIDSHYRHLRHAPHPPPPAPAHYRHPTAGAPPHIVRL